MRLLMINAFAGGLLLSSCSTTSTRISERPEVFNSLSPQQQAIVTRGDIRPGFSEDAVYLAWGPPTRKVPEQIRGRAGETWLYDDTAVSSYYPRPFIHGHGHGHGYIHGHTGGYGYFGYDPFRDPFFRAGGGVVRYPERMATFQNGRVIAYQYLPRLRLP